MVDIDKFTKEEENNKSMEMSLSMTISSKRKKRKIFKIAKIPKNSNFSNFEKNKKIRRKNENELKNNNINEGMIIDEENNNLANINQNNTEDLSDSDENENANNTNSDSENENETLNHNHTNSKLNPNSLISISKEVYLYLKENIESKGSSVTEYILKQLKRTQTNLSFKNIQRRVYDAINVMNAIGILKKEKNNLFFKGKMKMSNIGSKEKKIKNESKYLKEKIRQSIVNVNSKQHELVGLSSKVKLFI